MRTRIQDDQIRYDTHPMELQYVSLRSALVYLRMPKVQVEDVSAMRDQSIE